MVLAMTPSSSDPRREEKTTAALEKQLRTIVTAQLREWGEKAPKLTDFTWSPTPTPHARLRMDLRLKAAYRFDAIATVLPAAGSTPARITSVRYQMFRGETPLMIVRRPADLLLYRPAS